MSVAANEDFQLVEIDPASPARYPIDSRKGSFTGFSVDTSSYGWITQPPQESDRFLGEWKDTLGHDVFVFETPRRRFNGVGQKLFAVLSRPNNQEKTLAIRRDQDDRWVCGNGYLDRSKSSDDHLQWETADGRISHWKRTPPLGPVFFDPPPYLMKQFCAVETRKPRGGEKIVPALVESSQQCHVDETTGQLVWRLQDDWEKLKKFPANCCITSPTFTSDATFTSGAANLEVMQIVFYPTGSSTGKPASVLSLTREGIKLASLKVQFFLNGKPLGQKVCHDRRMDSHFARPSDDTTEVVISVELHRKDKK